MPSCGESTAMNICTLNISVYRCWLPKPELFIHHFYTAVGCPHQCINIALSPVMSMFYITFARLCSLFNRTRSNNDTIQNTFTKTTYCMRQPAPVTFPGLQNSSNRYLLAHIKYTKPQTNDNTHHIPISILIAAQRSNGRTLPVSR